MGSTATGAPSLLVTSLLVTLLWSGCALIAAQPAPAPSLQPGERCLDASLQWSATVGLPQPTAQRRMTLEVADWHSAALLAHAAALLLEETLGVGAGFVPLAPTGDAAADGGAPERIGSGIADANLEVWDSLAATITAAEDDEWMCGTQSGSSGGGGDCVSRLPHGFVGDEMIYVGRSADTVSGSTESSRLDHWAAYVSDSATLSRLPPADFPDVPGKPRLVCDEAFCSADGQRRQHGQRQQRRSGQRNRERMPRAVLRWRVRLELRRVRRHADRGTELAVRDRVGRKLPAGVQRRGVRGRL